MPAVDVGPRGEASLVVDLGSSIELSAARPAPPRPIALVPAVRPPPPPPPPPSAYGVVAGEQASDRVVNADVAGSPSSRGRSTRGTRAVTTGDASRSSPVTQARPWPAAPPASWGVQVAEASHSTIEGNGATAAHSAVSIHDAAANTANSGFSSDALHGQSREHVDLEDSVVSVSDVASDASARIRSTRRRRGGLLARVADEWHWTMIFPLVSTLYFVSSSVATLTVLGVDWALPCDEPLQLWLCINLVVSLLYVGLKYFSKEQTVDVLTSPPFWRRVAIAIFRVVKWTSLIWFYLGLFWIVSSDTCARTAPSIFYLTLTLVVINLVLVVLSLCMTCCLCSIAARSAVQEHFREAMNASSRPMNKEEIASVPEITFESGMYNAEDCVCAICLCDYEAGEKLRSLPCTHHFHTPCIDRWVAIDRSCPMCKQDISTVGQANSCEAPAASSRAPHTAVQNSAELEDSAASAHLVGHQAAPTFGTHRLQSSTDVESGGVPRSPV